MRSYSHHFLDGGVGRELRYDTLLQLLELVWLVGRCGLVEESINQPVVGDEHIKCDHRGGRESSVREGCA